MSRMMTPSHTYYLTLNVRGIRSEARAASLTVAADYACMLLAQRPHATPEIVELANKLVRTMIHLRRTTSRGDSRTKISEPGQSIEVTMDHAPRSWVSKGGPKESTNWDAVRNNFGVPRWK